jgi:2'-5' RNA ligase
VYRLFVAIELPPSIKSELAEIRWGVPGARWVAPDSMHLTVRFLGEVDGAAFADAAEALRQVKLPPFPLALKGVGYFPPRSHPEVLWVGVEPSEMLSRLHGKVDTALSRVGFGRDSRKFAPHVTLARLKASPLNKVAQFVAHYNLYRAESFLVSQFCLYSSHLASEGALHQKEVAYDLEMEGTTPDEEPS